MVCISTCQQSQKRIPNRRRRTTSIFRAKDAETDYSPGLETAGNNFTALKDIEEIQTILPHRCSRSTNLAIEH